MGEPVVRGRFASLLDSARWQGRTPRPAAVRKPLRLPRVRLPRARLRALELSALRVLLLGHLAYLYAWGLLAGGWWRLGTLALTTAGLLWEIREYPEERG